MLFINTDVKAKEIIFRQLILDGILVLILIEIYCYFGNESFNQFIGGELNEWLDYLNKNKIKVNYLKSQFIWRIKIFLKIILSLYNFPKL